jgi:hypothetical protein
MITKRFLYVCAGLLCLALRHDPAARADAQSRVVVECASAGPGKERWAVIGRRLYRIVSPVPVSSRSILSSTSFDHVTRDPVPGSARIVACGSWAVVLENGEIWDCAGREGWVLAGRFGTHERTR